jgi:hypothetical protein
MADGPAREIEAFHHTPPSFNRSDSAEFVIASEAKQSITLRYSSDGLLRRWRSSQ